jgi:hypothetical protein
LSGLLFTLYYVAVTSFWLFNVINALANKGLSRVVTSPEHSMRHAAVVYFWEVFYVAVGIAGLVIVAQIVHYWSWIDWSYCGFWFLFALTPQIPITQRAKNEFFSTLSEDDRSIFADTKKN